VPRRKLSWFALLLLPALLVLGLIIGRWVSSAVAIWVILFAAALVAIGTRQARQR
jgi:hypothetical protein